ncbi:1762_t:CDS:1, partial [Funneliformis caledonium]
MLFILKLVVAGPPYPFCDNKDCGYKCCGSGCCNRYCIDSVIEPGAKCPCPKGCITDITGRKNCGDSYGPTNGL